MLALFLPLFLLLLLIGVFSLVLGSPVRDVELFFIAIFLASLGFSITFTFFPPFHRRQIIVRV